VGVTVGSGSVVGASVVGASVVGASVSTAELLCGSVGSVCTADVPEVCWGSAGLRLPQPASSNKSTQHQSTIPFLFIAVSLC
jgi:hypothetical protein